MCQPQFSLFFRTPNLAADHDCLQAIEHLPTCRGTLYLDGRNIVCGGKPRDRCFQDRTCPLADVDLCRALDDHFTQKRSKALPSRNPDMMILLEAVPEKTVRSLSAGWCERFAKR